MVEQAVNRCMIRSIYLSALEKPSLKILLANPRGFCAGVDRAILVVERALEKFGPPVYVRHEIVHNRYVVDGLAARGAIFVDSLDDVPDNGRVIFSAHGVPKSVPAEAERRELEYYDATCPLVSKVHVAAARHSAKGRHMIMIGHAGHPEVIGTMGQLAEGAITLVENEQQAEQVEVPNPDELAVITQTTLSVDDTASIMRILERRFPDMQRQHKEDICYATTNRQHAVADMAEQCDVVFVVGAGNSSNSKRLVEVAERSPDTKACLVMRAADIDWGMLDGAATLGITAGASAPEILVQEIVDALAEKFTTSVANLEGVEENVSFKLPLGLRN